MIAKIFFVGTSMQFTDVWLVIWEMIAATPGGWWLDFWFRWLVYLAFGYTILLLFAVILRNMQPNLPARERQIAGVLSWIVSLSLLLIIPSLLVRLLPGLALRLAGFDPVVSLQQFSFDNLQYLVAILQTLSVQGGLGLLLMAVTSAHPATWRLVFNRSAAPAETAPPAAEPPPPNRELPQVQLIDELTPVPLEPHPAAPSPGPAPSPPPQPQRPPAAPPAREPSPLLPANMTADEITLIPSPPLPLAAWLRSVSYKGGNNQIFELLVSETEIGRQSGHITLEADFSVSSQHAAIRYSSGMFTLTDRSRFQSTWVNGLQLQKEQTVPLRDGDTLRLGESKFVFHTFRWPNLEFTAGGQKGRVLSNQAAPILIGSDEHNHIVVSGEGIAPSHARIELDHLRKTLLLRPEPGVELSTIQVHADDSPGGEPPWPLPAGSQVQLGPVIFKISFPGVEA
ncbi:MAG: hypothetical protein Kow0031_33640 [Anaerolineae bacterium]